MRDLPYRCLAVLRQRKSLTLAVTMPERGGDMEEDVLMSGPMTVPMPELPPMPPTPVQGPGGAGTLE